MRCHLNISEGMFSETYLIVLILFSLISVDFVQNISQYVDYSIKYY